MNKYILGLIVVLCIISIRFEHVEGSSESEISIVIEAVVNTPASTVSSSFVGFTTDWWLEYGPYGSIWGPASILTANLSDPLIQSAVKALAPATWRIGGTPADTVVYEIGNPPECPIERQGAYPKTKCLSMERWREICDFATKTGVSLVFGLNGMYGRESKTSPMNTTNFIQFLQHSKDIECPVVAWELGNELGNSEHSQQWKVNPVTLALDFKILRSTIDSIWSDPNDRPLMVGADNSPTFLWHTPFFDTIGESIDVFTYHSYVCDARKSDCASKLMNGLDQGNKKGAGAALSIKTLSKLHMDVWAGECGPAWGGGVKNFSNRFADAFYYVDKLGFLALNGIKVFARSSLIGGDYELLDRETHIPHPSYYISLLWARLMGTTSLVTKGHGPYDQLPSTLRYYCMCASTLYAPNGGITFALANADNVTVSVQLTIGNTVEKQHVWLVRGLGGDIHADSSELMDNDGNWNVIEMGSAPDYKPPSLLPISGPLDVFTLPPYSYAFIVLDGVIAEGCE